MDAVARSIAQSLTKYFGMPFLTPKAEQTAVVDVDWGSLNIRDKPDAASYVVTRAPNGARLVILNRYKNWYLVRYGDVVGWANADFVTLV